MLGKRHALWVDVGSLGWLVSYAADEYACFSAPRYPKRLKAEDSRHPNCESHCPGLWRMFDHHLQRWHFEFVEHVAGLAPEEVYNRRYFQLSSMTDIIWAAWGTDPGTTFANAGCFEIRAASLRFVYAWANAIIDGLEQPFLERFNIGRV